MNYNTISAQANSGMMGASGVNPVISLIQLFFTILNIILMWKLFSKAGIAGWLSLIPIVNVWYLYKMIYGTGTRFIAAIGVCIASVILGVITNPIVSVIIPFFIFIFLPYRLCQVFGKDDILSVIISYIPLFSIIYMLICFNDYKGPVKDFF